jgi:hypothetical protein
LYARLAALLFLSGRYPDQLAAAERGMAVAAQLGDQRLAPEAEYYRAFALFLLGQLVLLR